MKRVFVRAEYRRRNIARDIVVELESWAREDRDRRIILETGTKQPEALRLYESLGYRAIPNYGEYEGKPVSVCMAKSL
jgi:GNAT superfamily N-acetyltransferase